MRPRPANLLPIVQIAVVAIILVVGLYAENRTRVAISHQGQVGLVQTAEKIRADIETALLAAFNRLAQLEGALSEHIRIDAAGFERTAGPLVADERAIGGLFFRSSDGARLLAIGETGTPDEMIAALDRPGEVLTMQVRRAGPDALVLGKLGAVLDLDGILARTGLRDGSYQGAAFQLEPPGADGTATDSAPDASSTPVTLTIPLPGGTWTLTASPLDGARTGTAGIWAVRGLTILSVLLVLFYHVLTLRLVRARRDSYTELRARERALSHTSHRLDVALRGAGVGIWEYESTESEIWWDARMHAMFGLPEAAGYVDSTKLLDFIDADTIELLTKRGRAAVEENAPYDETYEITSAKGTRHTFRSVAVPFTDDNGKVVLTGITQDVTDQIANAMELDRRRREVEESAEARARHFATMSHEIRTPLNGLLGLSDLILRDDLSPRQRERAEVLKKSASHLFSIVNDLLELSSFDSPHIRLHPEPLDLRRTVADIAALMNGMCHDKPVEIVTKIERRVPDLVMCDPLRLRQVLMNLIGNAAKFTDEGTITVSADYDSEQEILHLSIADTGIGIAPDVIGSIFQRYSRSMDECVRSRGGSGLGLSICREVVDLMQGQIDVDSTPGKGSTFSLTLPAPDAASMPVNAEAPREDVADVATQEAPRRILIADDNPILQRKLTDCVESAGFAAEVAASGREVIDTVRDAPPALIVLDMEMPEVSGAQAAREIRAMNGSGARIPIIAVTAEDGEETRALCADAGIDAVLRKPVTMGELVSSIESQLGERAVT